MQAERSWATSRVAVATDLERFGDAVAVVDADGQACTHADLARRADDVAERLGTTRRLVLVEARNDLASIASLLGAMRGGHVVLLAGDDPSRNADLLDVHDPDVVLGADGALLERRDGTHHELHPDLALLLSTSGSTGSPKLVRLSGAAVDANARAIATYLGLRPDDRSITSLPLQYCYGLSVLTSHLAVGASVVCTGASVVDPCFWDAVDEHAVTNLAGVPHTFELLERAGFAERNHPTLRFVTQAGGRLPPDAVRRWVRTGQRHGFDLWVMYGQTEATARMAYLPPSLAEAHPDAVGLPVPGGSFRLEPVEGCRPDEGELVYAGPNVMLGYAESPADLALGPTVDELRTGDLARIGDDGLVRIVGRRREVLKVFGLRIDLRRVHDALAAEGIAATCEGDDDGLAIAVHDRTPIDEVRARTRAATGLPDLAIRAAAVGDVPRLANGKVDRGALVELVRSLDVPPAALRAGDQPVSALLAELVGADPRPEETFVSLGGDSLTYVEASIALEARLGMLPDGWHLRPLAELDAIERTGDPDRRRRAFARVETGIVLRALAIAVVVANHAGALTVPGGAHLLFAAAGFNVARFQLRSGWWAGGIARIVLPAATWIGGAVLLADGFDPAHVLLVHSWSGGQGRWVYWFVEALVHVLVATALVMRVPAVQRFERRRPFALPALLLVPTLAVRFDLVDLGPSHHVAFRSHEVAWLFVLGWLAASAATTRQRLLASAAVLAVVPGAFHEPTRDLIVLAGLLLLLWVPSIPVPRRVPPALAALAGASLYTYLSHVQVHPLVSDRSPVLGVALSLVVGWALWRVADPVVRRLVPSRTERTPIRMPTW